MTEARKTKMKSQVINNIVIKQVDIKISEHDVFPEKPSSGHSRSKDW